MAPIAEALQVYLAESLLVAAIVGTNERTTWLSLLGHSRVLKRIPHPRESFIHSSPTIAAHLLSITTTLELPK